MADNEIMQDLFAFCFWWIHSCKELNGKEIEWRNWFGKE